MNNTIELTDGELTNIVFRKAISNPDDSETVYEYSCSLLFNDYIELSFAMQHDNQLVLSAEIIEEIAKEVAREGIDKDGFISAFMARLQEICNTEHCVKCFAYVNKKDGDTTISTRINIKWF